MASGPINSWQIDRETMETVDDFIQVMHKTGLKERSAYVTLICYRKVSEWEHQS